VNAFNLVASDSDPSEADIRDESKDTPGAGTGDWRRTL